MAKKVLIVSQFFGGISESKKQGLPGSCQFARNLNIYDEPTELTLNPATAKESGSTVTGLVKWMVPGSPYDTRLYAYDDGGKIYDRQTNGTWTSLRTVASSVGQGLEVFNDRLYYAQNTQLGRSSSIVAGSLTFTDNYRTGLTDTSAIGFAPLKAFHGKLYMGHGNLLLETDGSATPTNAKLTLPAGVYIRALEIIGEFLVLGTWSGTSITDSSRGTLHFWDGVSTDVNFAIDQSEGAVNALLNSNNRLLSIIGESGYIYMGYEPFTKVSKIPKLEFSKYAEIFPGAVTNWKGISMFGISNTDSSSIVNAVYQYGSKSGKYPEALTCGYTISTGSTTGTTVKIGAIRGVGDELFIGWRDGSSYGVDKVVQTASPFASGSWESSIFDDGNPAIEKESFTLKASHKSLASGESVQLGYRRNRDTNFTTGTANSTVGSRTTTLSIPLTTSRFEEFEFEVILATSGSTSPTVTSVSLGYNSNDQEENDY